MTPSHVNGKGEPNDLSIFNGVEIDGKDSRGAYYHVVCLGEFWSFNHWDGQLVYQLVRREATRRVLLYALPVMGVS